MTEIERKAELSRKQREWVAKNKEHVSACRKARREGKNREMILAQKRAFYEKNKESIIAYQKEHRLKNIESAREAQKAFRIKNKERLKKEKAAEYQRNKARYKAANQAWKMANPTWDREWRSKNIEYVREKARKYGAERRQSDPSFKAMANQRSRLWSVLKKIGREKNFKMNTYHLQVKARLEPLFKPGMSWGNYGFEWHVDHIIPCAAFDFMDSEQAIRCFSPENLQPEWARENIQKGKKIIPELLEKHGLTMPTLDIPLRETTVRA